MNINKPNLLNTAAFLFAAVVLVFMLLQWLFSPHYKLTNQEMAMQLENPEMWLMPVDINEIAQKGDLENYLFVDLRSPEAFRKGTLPMAVNLPFEHLLDKQSLKVLDTKKTIFLFAEKESIGASAGLLLQSQGFENLRIAANDFDFLKNQVWEHYRPSAAFSHQEKARYDYNRYFRQAPKKTTETSSGIPSGPREEVVKVQGGC
jgi:rhodanese-related sulfurtransferase